MRAPDPISSLSGPGNARRARLAVQVATPARVTAANVEIDIRGLAEAVAVFIHPDGRVLLRRQGTADRAGFAHSELAVMRGMTLTHNHPCGLPPSAQDLALASSCQLQELRVVTAQHSHVIEGLPSHSRHYWRAAHAGAMRKVHPRIRELVLSARLDIAQASCERAHLACRLLAVQHGFTYARWPA
jgi:hypothetical protein